ALGGDVDLPGNLAVALENLQAALDLVGEQVAHCEELDIGIGAEGLAGSAGPTAAAADQTDLEGIAAGRMNSRSQAEGGKRGAGYRGGLEEVTARGGGLAHERSSPVRGRREDEKHLL